MSLFDNFLKGVATTIIGASSLTMPQVAIAEIALFGFDYIFQSNEKKKRQAQIDIEARKKEQELMDLVALKNKAMKDAQEANYLRASVYRWGKKQELGSIKNMFAASGISMYSGSVQERTKQFTLATEREVILMQQGKL